MAVRIFFIYFYRGRLNKIYSNFEQIFRYLPASFGINIDKPRKQITYPKSLYSKATGPNLSCPILVINESLSSLSQIKSNHISSTKASKRSPITKMSPRMSCASCLRYPCIWKRLTLIRTGAFKTLFIEPELFSLTNECTQ